MENKYYMESFNNYLPVKIFFGKGEFAKLGETARRTGKKGFIVASSGNSTKWIIEKAVAMFDQAGVQHCLYDSITPNPSDEIIDAGAEAFRRCGADFVIGIGGGSSMDSAKAIAAVAGGKLGIWEVFEGKEFDCKPMPSIMVPTTAGTGSEVTRYVVVSKKGENRKEGFARDEFYPEISILDPDLTGSLPPRLTAETGMDALSHAVEAYTSSCANTLIDIYSEKSIELISGNLIEAVYNGSNTVARSNMLLANTLAGMAITNADTSLAHVIGEALGAVHNISHGLSVAMALPGVMEFNCQTNIDKFAKISRFFNKDLRFVNNAAAAEQAPGIIRKLMKNICLPEGLESIGIKYNEEVLSLIKREGMDSSNRRKMDKADAVKLYKASLSRKMSYWEFEEEK